MNYLPSTTDTVINMPASDTGTNGEAYSVSATIPQREGYEFKIYYTLKDILM